MANAIKHLIRRTFSNTSISFGVRNLSVPGMMGKKLEGKVAVITGSTAGIGYAIAQDLAENGAKILISSRKQQNVDEAVAELKKSGFDVSGTVCHVSHEEDRKKLIQKAIDNYGKLDILILNAGINPAFGPILKTPEKVWDKIFDTNVKSGFLLAKEALPHLKQTKGSMTFVSSITGYKPINMIGAYSVSKTAILGLTKVLASEGAPLGIRVNGIAPGIIATDFSSVLTETEEISKQVLQEVAMNRFGKASECSGAVVFLSSDDASYITGETIIISGGMQCRL